MAGVSPTSLFPQIAQPQKRAFLSAYAASGRATYAAKAAKIAKRMHYYWLKSDPVYAEAFAEAKDLAGDVLEEEAMKRALQGSDTLLIFMLKGARPAKYRERYEHSGPGGGPLEIMVLYEADNHADEGG